ncbi:ATPase [Paraburkholderia sp. J67]|uniref:ATPase n=1 Tax=Paraburkholderia sp. J67 TaxID=2805435 RepID=UPI002ABD9241|nr:ATPase [Paraburkholderia sp. J67]
MLNELETLSQNIGRLIEINQRHHEARVALEEQLAQLRAQCEATRVELEQVREERNALQAERDGLSAKIDDAQVRLNAILEKLPRARAGADRENQLDLLDPSQGNADDHAARHGENA